MSSCAIAASAAVVKPMEEDEEKQEDKVVDMGEGSFIENLVAKQALMPWATIPVALGFWAIGAGNQVARKGPATSSRALWKAPAIQVELAPPTKIDEELVCWLQAEDLAADKLGKRYRHLGSSDGGCWAINTRPN